MLNWETNDTYWYVDKDNDMMIHQPYFWQTDDSHKNDAIGANFISFFCYNDSRFIESIKKCWVLKGNHYQGYRYPTHEDNDLSRDHTVYTVLAFKYSGWSDDKLQDFVKKLPWKISKRHSFTFDTWLWVRVISGIKYWNPLFYLIEILVGILTISWTKLIQLITGYGYNDEVHQSEFYKILNENKSKYVKIMNSLMVPVYALHIQAWKLKLLPDSIFKKILQKIYLKLAPKHNYVIKMLLGDTKSINEKDIYNYKPMTSFRWSGILHTLLNDRDMEIIKNDKLIEFNSIDKDYLIKLYENYHN